MWTIQCSAFPVLPIAVSLCGRSTRRPSSGQSGGLNSRTPSEPLDPPMIGGFHNGVGTFYGDDTVRGKRVRARFLWSNITPTSGHWEQADSPDGGKTWETNWVQDITRVR